MRLRFIVTILLIIYTLKTTAQARFDHISTYRVFTGWAHHFPQDWIILREFTDRDRHYYFLVNPQTLETKIGEASFYQVKPLTMAAVRSQFKKNPYESALRQAEKQSVTVQDAGIERGMPKETGISLTADLCPSHKPLDRVIFTDIITEFKKVERPVPVALSITGTWIRRHQPDLEWLKQLQAKHEIYITWINHSYTHRVSNKLPIKENFLLEPGTNISYEVLENEKAMLANGLLPSVFFRFPGLVSDQQLVYRITDFGLIPIGTDAWLAKGQRPATGSIVLIHGNGNEPVGVRDFIQLLRSKSTAITKKQWLLYDLRESIDEEFETEK